MPDRKSKPTVRIVGWSAAKGRYGDPTGRCHLLIEQQVGCIVFAVPACGAKCLTSGQIHKDAPDYAPTKCRTCAKIEKRIMLGR